MRRKPRMDVERSITVDRLPPFALEAEAAILGCMLLDPNAAVPESVAVLGDDGGAWYDLRHRTLFLLMVRMYDARQPIDIVSVIENLRRSGQLEAVGGQQYVSTLPDATPTASNVAYWLEIVMERWIQRRLIHVCADAISDVYEHGPEELTELLDKTERAILSLRPMHMSRRGRTIKDHVKEAVEKIEMLYARKGDISGLATGFEDLDKLTDGLHPGEMTVLSGFPGHGKTAFALNIAEYVSVTLRRPVGLFSLEMTAVSLVTRCLCSQSRINLRDVRDGFMSERDFPRLTAAAGKLMRAPVWIDDQGDLTIWELRARARRWQQEHPMGLFIIDYLQRLSALGGARKIESRQQEVSDISNGIKSLAMELNVPVLVLSQLNDDGKLRESRAIGQDGDNVLRLEKVKGEDNEDDDGGKEEADARLMNLRIMKQRNGPTGVVPLVFLKRFTRFESAAKVTIDDEPVYKQPYAD